MTKEKKSDQPHYRKPVILHSELNPDMEIIKRDLLQTLDENFEEKKPHQLPIREPVVLDFDPTIPIEIINRVVENALERRFKGKNYQTPVDSNDTKNPRFTGDKRDCLP
ncbi:MAG: hypothetical protein PHR98_03620 [Candidatus Shapirobacteria bacterium]|nr:hypothetical protein [Candidatus Shapirobacteria bacterium]